MYHNGTKINELKRIAVFCYWVLRLKPITRIAGGPSNINEQVVLQIIIGSIKNYRLKMNLKSDKFSAKLKNDMLYSLTYRDISYDYMTLLIEGLAE
ncbi:MAG: hypothetical protein FWF81_02695 [Defluviitaleaceae bacterium]|nr:hypothetical protein [Defluviitaleaceae bacterium]